MTIKETLARGYVRAFATDRGQAMNHALYHLALRGMGYNNGWQPDHSGEEWFIKNVLSPSMPRLSVDIGANVGEYSRLLLRHTTSKVFAFEPLPEAHARLGEINERYPHRFNAYRLALGNVTSQLELHYGDPLTEHASLSASVSRIDYVGERNTKTMIVDVVTLDDFIHTSIGHRMMENLDFIKIDVEGYEWEVLEGAEDTILHFCPKFIQIEWNLHQLMRGHTFLKFADRLYEYTPFQLLPSGIRRVDPNRPESNTFCYANFVFVRNDITGCSEIADQLRSADPSVGS
jgi:FkbM family methyltransferase